MAIIADTKSTIAGILGAAVSDFTVNGIDMLLLAMNSVRLQAEQTADLEFLRKLLSVSVNTTTGGDLSTAVLYGTATAVSIKEIVAVGQMDDQLNFRRVDWLTTSEASFDEYFVPVRRRIRNLNNPNYATYGEFGGVMIPGCANQPIITFIGDTIYFRPKAEVADAQAVTLVLEAYCFTADWVALSTADTWLTKGINYIIWASVVWLNHNAAAVFGKQFVPRQEGNLGPPTELRDQALAAFVQWDQDKFGGYRHHVR